VHEYQRGVLAVDYAEIGDFVGCRVRRPETVCERDVSISLYCSVCMRIVIIASVVILRAIGQTIVTVNSDHFYTLSCLAGSVT
jgi:hypothetical protein